MSLQEISDSFFENKIPSPPLFFITYGPPGSGKTDIIKDMLKRFKISEDRIIRVLVDEIIERIPGYLVLDSYI